MFGWKCTFWLILTWNLIFKLQNSHKNLKLSQRRGTRIHKQYYVNLKESNRLPIQTSKQVIIYSMEILFRVCRRYFLLCRKVVINLVFFWWMGFQQFDYYAKVTCYTLNYQTFTFRKRWGFYGNDCRKKKYLFCR